MRIHGNRPLLAIMKSFYRIFILLIGIVSLPSVSFAEESTLARGQRLIEANCTPCHAIGETGDSPFAPAPPFREVAKNYSRDELVDGFMEGLAVRHPAMPDWDMTVDQAEAISTYIMGLSRTGGAKAGGNPITIGHELLSKNCARCQAIDMTSNSPLAKAPPFREVVKRYDPNYLEEALAEGIVTGHNEMPEFGFEAEQVAAIVAYLATLKPE